MQTLAENAVTHGIEPRAAGGTLRIALAREGGRLIIQVRNPRTQGAEVERHGIGLAGARARLQLAFGEEARLQVAETDDAFEVKVECPWVKAEDERAEHAYPDR